VNDATGGRRRGAPGALLVIISGPSGVGKDAVIAALRRRVGADGYHYLVTCTTRAHREPCSSSSPAPRAWARTR